MFAQERDQFYLFLLEQLLRVVSAARKMGIEVEDLVP